jgi:hypothetical protein
MFDYRCFMKHYGIKIATLSKTCVTRITWQEVNALLKMEVFDYQLQ